MSNIRNNALEKELLNVADTVNAELSIFFDKKKKETGVIDNLHLDALSILEEYTLRGGKRVRAFLCWCSFLLSGGKESNSIFKVCSAIELLHAYICNLDDMADRDKKRHNGPSLETFYQEFFSKTLQEKQAAHFGRSFSEIIGALLNTYSSELLCTSGFSSNAIVQAMKSFNTTMFEETSIGWQIHFFQNIENISSASKERFLKGLELVTAQYTFVGPLHIGTILAENQNYSTPLLEYGKHVGTAFQIQDDILGVFGKTEKTGKPVGNDLREGKKTLLLQYAYQHCTEKDKEFLRSVIGHDFSDKQLSLAQNLIIETGSLQYSQDLAKTQAEKGKQALQSIQKNNTTEKYLRLLSDLANFVITREK